jgi:predicted RNase H-like HicB family nuclease
MIKKDAIRKTAVTYWSDEDNAFIVESPLFTNIAGVAETRAEAFSIFEDMLDTAYEHLKNDNVVGYKRGRPAKGGVDFHCQVQQPARDEITKLAKKLGGISQGETVEFLLHYYQCKSKENYSNQPPQHDQDLDSRLENVEWIMTRAIANSLVMENEAAYNPKSKKSSNAAKFEIPPNVSASEFLAALVETQKRKLPDVRK